MDLRYRVPGTLVTVFLLIACAIGVGYVLASGSFRLQQADTGAAVKVTAVPVSNINKPVRLAKAGLIGRAATTAVTADFSGQISEVYVAEGQQVKAGQPICKLEPSPAAYAAEAAPVPVPAPAPSSAGIDYEDALKEYSRLQKLYDIGAIPRRQLEAAAARLQAAKDGTAGEPPAAGVSGTARTTVSGPVTVTAPVDGQVAGLAVTPGKSVQAGQQLMTLGSGQDVELVVPLTEEELYLVSLGTSVILETGGQQVAGQVAGIYPEVKDNQTILFAAHCKLAGNPGGLQPGLPVNAHLNTGRSVAVQAVPTASVVHDEQGGSFIYTAVGGAAVLQPVITGDNVGAYTEILSPLPQDTLVITGNIEKLRDGVEITLAA